MVEINYELIPIKKEIHFPERAVKNAFYIREEDEQEEFTDLYMGYHTYDYFGYSVLTRVPVEEVSNVKTLVRKK